MIADANWTVINRIGGLTVALGMGAAIACGATGQAWATEDSFAVRPDRRGECFLRCLRFGTSRAELSPWLDVSMSDPRSAQIDDPLLNVTGLAKYRANEWAGNLSTQSPLVSPLYGSLDGLATHCRLQFLARPAHHRYPATA